MRSSSARLGMIFNVLKILMITEDRIDFSAHRAPVGTPIRVLTKRTEAEMKKCVLRASL
jgi:hypothetical protein